MKVLWLCNTPLTEADSGQTGTWLDAMAKGLVASGQIELGIIALGGGDRFLQKDYREVRQWTVPSLERIGRNGLPKPGMVADILAACRSFAPDLVHVWGTEAFWGLLTARGLIRTPNLLTMQGVKYRVAEWFDGGMNWREKLASIGLVDVYNILKFRTPKIMLKKWGPFEKEIMAGHRYVSCHSPWQAAQVKSNNLHAHLFHLDLPLRPEFEQSKAWEGATSPPTIFCISSYGQPSKGLHVAIRALALLKRRFPDIQMRIAGAKLNHGSLRRGYLHWIDREICRLNLNDNVSWLGRLSANEIAQELRIASATVIPTFVESYSVAFAEALRIGTPTVVSFTGGTGYLGRDEETCLFFPIGDEAACAYQLERLLTNRELAAELSQKAREAASARHDRNHLVQGQMDIYREVLSGSPRLVANA